MSGVSQGVISKTIYRNESAMNLSQFEFICDALGVSPSKILEQAERSLYRPANQLIDNFALAAYEGEDDMGVDHYEG